MCALYKQRECTHARTHIYVLFYTRVNTHLHGRTTIHRIEKLHCPHKNTQMDTHLN